MSKLKILIDLTKVKNPYCGLGQFSINFGNELIRQNPDTFDFSFLLHPKSSNVFEEDIKIETPSLIKHLYKAKFKKYSLWHSTHQDSRFHSLLNNIPYILTIHDLNFLEEKSLRKRKQRLKLLQKKIDKASAITTISEYTKQELIKNFTIPDIPFRVIYNGVEDLSMKDDKKTELDFEGDFLFTIGVVTAKKNIHVLIDFISKIPKLNLIIAGDDSGEYAIKIRELIKDKDLQNRIFLTGKISENEKIWYYKNCKAFVFPSLLEGFGLPLIEAMQFGKAVFASNRCSLPEIAKDKAYYWDNFDPDYMAGVYTKMIKEYNSDIKTANSIKKHAFTFSMDRSISEYINLYNEILFKKDSGL